MPSYDFRARVGLTRSQGVANLLFTLCAPDVSFQRGFLIYVKIRAGLRRKSSISLADNLSRELLPFLCALRWGIDRQVRDRR